MTGRVRTCPTLSASTFSPPGSIPCLDRAVTRALNHSDSKMSRANAL